MNLFTMEQVLEKKEKGNDIYDPWKGFEKIITSAKIPSIFKRYPNVLRRRLDVN